MLGNGQIVEGFTWVDPAHPGFQSFMSSVVKDVMSDYSSYKNFMGVQFDDHLAYPNELPLSAYASSRSSAVDSLVQTISSAAGASYFSIAPMVMPQSRDKHNANWPNWVNSYKVYEAAVQTYYDNVNSFATTLDN